MPACASARRATFCSAARPRRPRPRCTHCKAIELDPKRVDAHFLLGQTDLAQHDAAAALPEFAAVLEHEPGNLKALNNKGIALDFMGRSAEAQDCISGRAQDQPE